MVAAVAALFAFGWLPVLRPSPLAPESHAPVDQGASEVAADTGIDAISALARPNYSYSVIPGGARNAHELALAMQTDEVVADHYRDVDPTTMHPQIVPVEHMAHVSYRINDRVFWTRKPVRIYEGETILTNGETQIRARCGNAISMAPLLPTSDDEPESTEFDALTGTGPMLVAFDLPPAVSSAMARPVGDVAGDGLLPAHLVPPFGIGGAGGSASVANHGQANEGIPGAALQGIVTAPLGPPELVPFGFDLFGFDPSEFDPSEPGPLVLQPLLGPEPDPTTFAVIDPAPVPEPATLVLLGSGIAGLLARHRRQKSK